MTSATDKLTFVPSKSVTFMPNGSKQMAEMTVTNESDKTIMFKMKSTKPGMFKMRPVYGAVGPNDKSTIRLIFKGLKPGQEAPKRERCIGLHSINLFEQFTMVTAIAPSLSINTEKVWKMHKYQEKLAENEMAKKRFRILFFGVNDQEEDDEDEKNGSQEKDVKKGITEGDPPNEDKDKVVSKNEKTTPDVIVKREVVEAPPKKLVVVMYRDQKEDSLSGEDDGDDINTYQPIAQPKTKTTEAKLTDAKTNEKGVKSAMTQPPMSVQKSAVTQPPMSAAQKSAVTQPPMSAAQKSAVTQPPMSAAQKSSVAPKSALPLKTPSKATSLSKVSSTTQQRNIAELDDELIGTKTCRQNKNFDLHPQEAGK